MKLLEHVLLLKILLIIDLKWATCGKVRFSDAIKSLSSEKSRTLKAIENLGKTKSENLIYVYVKMKKLISSSKKNVGCGMQAHVWDDVSRSLNLNPIKLNIQNEEMYYCDYRLLSDLKLRNVYKVRLTLSNGTYSSWGFMGNRDPVSVEINSPCNNQLLIEHLCIGVNNKLWREGRVESKSFCIKEEMIRSCFEDEYYKKINYGNEPYKLILNNLSLLRKILESTPDENYEDSEYNFCDNLRLELLEVPDDQTTCTCDALEFKDQKKLSVNVFAVGFEPEHSLVQVNPADCKEKCVQ